MLNFVARHFEFFADKRLYSFGITKHLWRSIHSIFKSPISRYASSAFTRHLCIACDKCRECHTKWRAIIALININGLQPRSLSICDCTSACLQQWSSRRECNGYASAGELTFTFYLLFILINMWIFLRISL